MKAFIFTAALAAVPGTVFAAAANVQGERYIVTLKAGSCTGGATDGIESIAAQLETPDAVVHKYNNVLCGFAAHLPVSSLETVRALADVRNVEPDSVMTISEAGMQVDAPWGLERITQRERLSDNDISLTYNYSWDDVAGANVEVFVIDTGIRASHQDFEGRATMKEEAVFGPYKAADGHGHGTHCASTVGGAQFGVAKNVVLHGVKVLSDEGSGSTSDIIAGIDYVVGEHQKRIANATVINMSLGGGYSWSLNLAVDEAGREGIHFAVAAGNDAANACMVSPASAPGVVTVAASDIFDRRASYSNFGGCVEILAPGSDITGAWATSDTATHTISGTSMATPHVAGTMAYMLSEMGDMSPSQMKSQLVKVGTRGAINMRSDGTPNVLLYRPTA